jgi:hypothetical protein
MTWDLICSVYLHQRCLNRRLRGRHGYSAIFLKCKQRYSTGAFPNRLLSLVAVVGHLDPQLLNSHFLYLSTVHRIRSFFSLISLWARKYAPRGVTFLSVPGSVRCDYVVSGTKESHEYTESLCSHLQERWAIVASDTIVSAIYRDSDGAFGKTQAWMDAISILAPLSLVPVEGATWKRHRKLVAHAFSYRHLVLAGRQGDISCRRLLRGFTAGAVEDPHTGGRTVSFDASECFLAVFLDVQASLGR